MSVYRPYPKYKPSGVEWLGDLPDHWMPVKSRRMFEQRKTRALPTDKQLTASQKYGVISQEDFVRLEEREVVKVFIGSELLKHVEKGDFVISMRSFQGGIEYCGVTGCTSSAYVPLIPIKWVHSNFFTYLFKSGNYIQALQSTSNLVRDGQALRFDNFSLVDLPCIPLPEQIQIAAFLDRECDKLDALHAKQERLIELLKEKRQALISHAVTRGLDPTAPLKPSGIEWLGDVPAHWRVLQLKFALSDIEYGTSESSRDSGDCEILGMGDIREGLVTTPGVRFLDNIPEKLLLRPGDLLFNRTNSLALVGKTGIYRGLSKTSFASYLVRFRTVRDVSPEFLNYLLGMDSVLGAARGMALPSISQANLNPTRYSEINICKPPLAEQQAIVAHLDEKCGKIDRLKAKAERAIELLKERRSALISAAVTGKIDVRNS